VGVDNITDLDVECLKPSDVVIAGRQLPQLARLHGYGFVVDLQAVWEADLSAKENDDTLCSCIQGGDGQPPAELRFAAVACAASGTVRGIPVQQLQEDDEIDRLDLTGKSICTTGAALLAFMLPAATSVRSLILVSNGLGSDGCAALAKGLKGNLTLRTLYIANNDIGCQGASALAAILKETEIVTLGLFGNGIGVKGASALAAVLKETRIAHLEYASTSNRRLSVRFSVSAP